MRLVAFLGLLLVPHLALAAGSSLLHLRLNPATGDNRIDLRGAELRTDVTGSRVWITRPGGKTIYFALQERMLRVGVTPALGALPSGQRHAGHCAIDLGQTNAGPALVARQRDGRGPEQDCWRAQLPAAGAAVTVSGDERLVLAALEDGTLRWFAAASGQPLLSLALEPKDLRWVVWTPSGYYDAAAKGADRLGWELPRAQDQPPDFFRISLFRDRLQRPDLISRVLFVQDEQRALDQVNAESGHPEREQPLQRALPPVVRVLSPVKGSVVKQPRLTVRFAVRSPSGEPVQNARVLVGSREAQTRGAAMARRVGEQGDQQLYEQEVDLPAEDSILTVMAETSLSRGEPAVVELRWGGKLAPNQGVRPDLYLLAVGVGGYKDPQLRLDYPAKDARDLAAAFAAQQGRRYRHVETRVLTDQQASLEAILAGLRWLRQSATSSDVAAVLLAGHGITDPALGTYAYYPYDVEPGRPETVLAGDVLRKELGRTPGHVLLFIDTCHAGKVDLSRLTDDLTSVENGVVVYAASTGGQLSRESPQWGNGAFTKAVVEGLRGGADLQGSGRVTVSELEHYVSERVRQLTQERQVPTSAKPGSVPDFLLATVNARYKLEKKWWFWATAGAAVAGMVGLGVGLSQYAQRSNVASGIPVISF